MTPTPAIEAAGNEAHHAYLLALNDTLRPLGDPVDIQAAACRLLGQHLQAHRVAYFEVRGDDYVIERDYTHGVGSIVGRYPVIAFGQKLLAAYRRGEVAVETNVAADTDLTDGERALYAALQLGAHIGVPLLKNGQFVVGLAVHSKVPHAWTPAEVALVEETAEHTWAAVERARAEAALARSEQHYRMLFDSIDQGLCTIEVLFDDQGKPHDYRFLHINAAFERQTGMVDALGKRVREIVPGHEAFWFDVYGRIALTGKAQRFEHAAEALGRFYEVFAFRIGAPEERQVVVHFSDISERKRHEANLAFLSDIGHDLVKLSHADDSLKALGAKIGQHLRVSRCELVDLNDAGDEMTLNRGWHSSDLQTMVGVYRMADYLSDGAQRSLHNGDVLVVGDVAGDSRVHADKLAPLRIGAFICAPITRDGRARFMLAVKDTGARTWSADEVQLVQELATRVWTRLEQARAEEALKVSDARQRALFSQMLGGVAETDLNGRFTSVNRRYCEILGYSRDELIGMRMQDILYEEDRPVNLERRERLIRFGEQFEIEKRYVRKDGAVIWVHNSVSRLSDVSGKPLGIISVSLDITERKQQEEQLRRGAEMLDFIVQHSPSGFYIVDADFRISHINAETQARAFRNVNPAIGQRLDVAMRVLWPEPLATEFTDLFRHTLATGGPYVSDTLIAQRADTEEVETYNWQLQRLTMPDGRNAVVCFYYDTTRLRRAEQELREADQRKDEFLATLAHELRNPLAPIRNSLHILRLSSQNEGRANERVHDMLDRQVSHMVRLVDDLMEVSRITRGKFELRKERLELASVVQNAIETCTPLVEAAGQQLIVSLPQDAPLVLEADAVRLAQVLANLLNNASKYTEAGGRIWLSAHRDNREVVVSVKDDGAGIPVGMLPGIFDLFVQGDSTYHRAQGGLGIGLTLVRSIVTMHGGTVEAHSDGPGHGSEFVVRLPLTAGGPAASAPDSATATPETLKLRRVLVVDDNQDSADSMEMVLEFLGADVRAVYDGASAIEAFATYQPSAVFLDIGMPGMDGFEVARALRQIPSGHSVKLIALTGWGQPEDLRRSKDAGFDCHLVKPVDLEAVQALLNSLA